MPYPLFHLKTAEKHFDKLNSNIKRGSVGPDYISVALKLTYPLMSTREAFTKGHTILTGLKNKDFEKAYNYHIKIDNYTENKYFFKLVPAHLKKEFGILQGHAIVEAAVDYLLYKDGVYYQKPSLSKELLEDIEDCLDKNLLMEKFAEFTMRWKRTSYMDFITRALRETCIKKFKVLSEKDVIEEIKFCADMLEDDYKGYTLILNDALKNAHKLKIKTKRF